MPLRSSAVSGWPGSVAGLPSCAAVLFIRSLLVGDGSGPGWPCLERGKRPRYGHGRKQGDGREPEYGASRGLNSRPAGAHRDPGALRIPPTSEASVAKSLVSVLTFDGSTT